MTGPRPRARWGRSALPPPGDSAEPPPHDPGSEPPEHGVTLPARPAARAQPRGAERGRSPDRSAAGWSDPGPTLPAASDPDHLAIAPEARYLDLELAGTGGMGTVMMAHDRVLGRDIAIKRVAIDGDDRVASRRLAREAQITARLEHPGIVPIYDAGVGADGRSYYAMRLIRGRSLDEVLAGTTGPGDRLPLMREFLAVCQAVAYAHRHGVLHLDLKPTNVMVGEFGETLVVDWGLARRRDDAPHDDGLFEPGQVAGTPAYLNPERARGEPADTPADVWALGAILVEVLTGARLMPGPTTATLALLLGAAAPPRPWPDRCPPELCAIADKALAWNPRERYQDGEALAHDVAAYLDGRRVGAHDYSTLELARRLIHAWRWRLTAVAAALVTGVIVLALSRSRIEGQRQRAVAAEQQARDALIETRAGLTRSLDQSAVAALLTGDLAAAESFAAAALTHGESVDARGVLAATRAGSRPAAALRLDLPGCGDVIPDDDQYALCRSRDHLELWQLPADHPRWRQRLSATRAVSLHGRWVAALEVGSSAALLDGKTGDVRLRVMVGTTVDSVVRARDGNRAAFHDRHRIWLVDPDRPDATAVRVIDPACAPSTLDAVALGAARAFAVCGDGRVVSITDDGHRTTIARLVVTAADQIASVAAIDEDERTLGFGRIIGDVALVDLATGAVTAPVKLLDERVAELQLVAGMIVVVGERGGARVWNRALDAELLRLPERAGRLLASAGDHLITGGAGWWRWSLAPPPMPRRFVAPAGLSSAAISPDGTRIAAARGDGRISIWSTATGDLIAQPALAEAVIKRLDFSPDGQALAVGISSTPGSALLATGTWQRLPHQPSKGGANRLSYLADGELIAVHYVRSLTRWRPGYARDEIPVTGFIDAEPTASRDALWLLARAGQVARYRAGIVTDVFTAPGAESLAPSSDGRRVAVGLPDGVELHDLVAGTITPLVGSGDRVLDVAISPGDRWLAAANAAGTLDVWSLPDGRWVAHLRGHQQRVAWVGFAAGALWSASWDGAVQRWDLAALAATPAALAADAAATWALP